MPALQLSPDSCSFNPHPPLLAGETLIEKRCGTFHGVSIHTRHYWRVKRPAPLAQACPASFNPHPPLLAGETHQSGPPAITTKVSIHTRHYWRVKLFVAAADAVIIACFNPHPPLLAGETRIRSRHPVSQPVSIHTRHYWRVKHPLRRVYFCPAMFQSTPAITGG